MFIMYKAVNGVVTHIMVYVGKTKKPIALESKYSPYHEMRLDVYRPIEDLNAGGGYRIFSLPYNAWIRIGTTMYIAEKDITSFHSCNSRIGEGSRTEKDVQVSNERIQLCK